MHQVTSPFNYQELKANLETRQRETMTIDEFRPAAVLVPLLKKESGYELLFTVRSSQLRSHAGQISFPGGRLDEGETIIDAACRETFEEIGISIDRQHILGFLDDHPSPARYIVTPVLALVSWPQPLCVNHCEVDEVFTVPLETLLQLEPRAEDRELRNYKRKLHYYDYQGYSIWGLTGNVVKNFLDVWRQVHE
ncbi:MAG: CoA pyrophosphatase [Trueperaceae bacterium]|nr:CoA pyrophosphatase [Trueperaceae bacterium]